MKQDREAVKTLAISIGVREAARRLGLNEDTVCSWAKREAWFTPKPQPPSQAIVTQALQATPSDALADVLAEHERETRLSLARYASKCSETAAASPNLEQAPLVHKVAQIAGLTHRWAEQSSGNQFSLNVLNVESFNVQVNE